MTSRWPSVVSRPTFAPLRSSSALVATVVPWTMRSVLASRPARSVPHSPASRPRPSMRPSDWSRGVDAHLAMTTRPVSSTAARSVKVPPTSIPIRHIALVEARAVAGLQPAREILDAHARDGDLVVEHLRRRRQAGDVGPARRLPESRAFERLRAVDEHLLDLDADGETRDLVRHGQGGEQVGVARDAGPAVHAQRLAAAGHEEEQSHARVGEDVPHAVEPLVARPIGQYEVGVVEGALEPRGFGPLRDTSASP